MRIAQAAHQVGLSPTTLKRLEKRGLIRVRKDRNGQRRYTDRDIETIRALYYPPAPAPAAAPQTRPTAPSDATASGVGEREPTRHTLAPERP